MYNKFRNIKVADGVKIKYFQEHTIKKTNDANCRFCAFCTVLDPLTTITIIIYGDITYANYLDPKQ